MCLRVCPCVLLCLSVRTRVCVCVEGDVERVCRGLLVSAGPAPRLAPALILRPLLFLLFHLPPWCPLAGGMGPRAGGTFSHLWTALSPHARELRGHWRTPGHPPGAPGTGFFQGWCCVGRGVVCRGSGGEGVGWDARKGTRNGPPPGQMPQWRGASSLGSGARLAAGLAPVPLSMEVKE